MAVPNHPPPLHSFPPFSRHYPPFRRSTASFFTPWTIKPRRLSRISTARRFSSSRISEIPNPLSKSADLFMRVSIGGGLVDKFTSPSKKVCVYRVCGTRFCAQANWRNSPRIRANRTVINFSQIPWKSSPSYLVTSLN